MPCICITPSHDRIDIPLTSSSEASTGNSQFFHHPESHHLLDEGIGQLGCATSPVVIPKWKGDWRGTLVFGENGDIVAAFSKSERESRQTLKIRLVRSFGIVPFRAWLSRLMVAGLVLRNKMEWLRYGMYRTTTDDKVVPQMKVPMNNGLFR